MTWVAGLAALAIAGATLYAGRRDVTRPAVVFGVVWFGCAALAQLRLTLLETPWATGYTVLVFAGGLAFMLAVVLAGGTAPARLGMDGRREWYSPRRMIVAGAVLAAGAVAGVAYKAHVLGGLPLLSGNADELRANAYKGGGAVPAWSSALTDGFFLAMWCFLVALWLLRGRAERWKLAAIALCAAACLFGVALLASRNTVLLAIVVPLTAAYLFVRPRRRMARGGALIAAAGLVALVIGGLLVFRLAQGEGRNAFLDREMDRRPPVVRPLIPFYVSVVYPFEAASRVYRAVPHPQPYTLGASSLTSLPDAFFPKGKPPIASDNAALMRTPSVGSQPTWTVAGYQGRLFRDAGWAGVLLGSLLLGLGFGALYRWARLRRGFLPAALVGYVAYYTAFLVYDNLLSFTIIAIYDLAVVALVDLWARGRLRATFASLLEPPPKAALAIPATRPKRTWTLSSLRPGPAAALALLLLAAGAVWIYAGRGLTFFGDEWDFAYHRRDGGLDAFLLPHNEHAVVALVAYFKLMWSTVGLTHYWPYLVANVIVSLVGVAVVFDIFRRRVGLAVAFCAASLLAFFGRGYSDVLWDFEIGFLFAVVAGVAAFELFRRRGVPATVLLTFSLASASWGLVFALAILVAVALTREWRRLAVPLVPLALYALWYANYGVSELKPERVPDLPGFVADAMSSTLANLAGVPLTWGRVLAVIAAIAVVARFVRPPRPGPVQIAALLLPLLAWVITGLARRDPFEPRYAWAFAALVLVAAAYLLPRIRPSRAMIVAGAVIVGAAVASNLSDLRTTSRALRTSAQTRLTQLGAVDISRPSVSQSLALEPLHAFGHFRTDLYVAATDAYGTPGYDERRIRALPAGLKLVADTQMLSAAPPVLVKGARPGMPAPLASASSRPARCVRAGPQVELELPSSGIVTEPRRGRNVTVVYRRYAPTYAADQRTTISARTAILPPTTIATTPWTVRLASPAPFRVCGGPAK